MDAVEDDVVGSDDVSLDSDSEMSSDESIITSSAARTRSSSLFASLVRSVSFNPNIALFIIFIISIVSSQYFCQGDIYEPLNDRLFSFLPLMKNHSNQKKLIQ